MDPSAVLRELRSIPGNTAKMLVTCELVDLIRARPGLRILDTGCVGPSPWNGWWSIFERAELKFELTGVDVMPVEEARRELGRWPHVRAELHQASAYDLEATLAGRRFDAVASMQVLEHIGDRARYFDQLRRVTEPGGVVLLTCDSAHHSTHRPGLNPVAGAKAIVKEVLRAVGNESHYDSAVRDDELKALLAAAGFAVEDFRYMNHVDFKKAHNHGVDPGLKDAVARAWFDLEHLLSGDRGWAAAHRHLFAGLYVKARKS